MKHGALVPERPRDGAECLVNASFLDGARHRAVVGLMVEHRVDLSTVTLKPSFRAPFAGAHVLHILAFEGKAEIVLPYLEHGVSVDVRDPEGRTPLAAAIASLGFDAKRVSEQLRMVRLLLERGAEPTSTDASGRDILAQAASFAGSHGKSMRLASKPLLEQPAFRASLADALAAATPTERAAVVDRVLDTYEREQKELAKRRAENARKEELERSRRQAELSRLADQRREQQEAARERQLADQERNMPPICKTPEMKACRARARSCNDCFIDSMRGSSSGGGSRGKTCSYPETACGLGCCKQGESCCVSGWGTVEFCAKSGEHNCSTIRTR